MSIRSKAFSKTSTMEQRIAASMSRPRQREVGVRMAIGARPGRMVREILSGGFRLTCLGLTFGLGAAFAILLFTAAAACYLPARRAARVDPAMVLREE